MEITYDDLAEVVLQFLFNGAASSAASSGMVPADSFSGGADEIYNSESFGYTTIVTTTNQTQAVDGGVRLQARAGTVGPVLAAVVAATLDQAVALITALPAVVATGFASVQTVANGTSQTTATTTMRTITGRDTYLGNPGTVAFGAATVLIGNLGE